MVVRPVDKLDRSFAQYDDIVEERTCNIVIRRGSKSIVLRGYVAGISLHQEKVEINRDNSWYVTRLGHTFRAGPFIDLDLPQGVLLRPSNVIVHL